MEKKIVFKIKLFTILWNLSDFAMVFITFPNITISREQYDPETPIESRENLGITNLVVHTAQTYCKCVSEIAKAQTYSARSLAALSAGEFR